MTDEIYIGSRYVPKIVGDWKSLIDYEELSIVLHEGNSYTSKKKVPAGVELSDENYWAMTGNLNANLSNLTAQLAQKAEQSDLNIEKGRINNLVAHAGDTDGNSELLDIRVGVGGITYTTAGDATRAVGKSVFVPATNEIVNGSFAKGSEGWTSHNGSITTSGDTIRITGGSSGVSLQLWQPSASPTGRKYYLTAHVKAVEDISRIRLSSYPETYVLRQLNAPSHSEWLRVSAIYDAKYNLTRTLFFTFDSEGTGLAELKHPLIIDLTTTFGKGNEPTAEQMDRLLTQFPNSWFDGTVNVYNSKHMMIMFFKELTKLNNAITTLGGNV